MEQIPGYAAEGIHRYRLLIGASWALVGIVSLLGLNVGMARIDAHIEAMARERGSALFRLVELARDWNARHGGVYVPVTPHTQPNPYLDHPRRDVVTADGVPLTLVNPAFMTRQIAEIAEQVEGVKFHITSLKPIRPANRADHWEGESLRQFEAGVDERLEQVGDGDASVYRYMAPLLVRPHCMKCHEKQGYKVGDVRGGISVSMPAARLLAVAVEQRRNLIEGWISAFIVIAGLLHFAFWRARRYFLSLRAVNARQEELIADRTRELSIVNDNLQREVLRHQQALTLLEDSEARYRSVVENVAAGVMVVDVDGRILKVNPAFSVITGYSAHEAVGGNPRMLKSGRHSSAFYEEIWRNIVGTGHWEGEIWNRRKNGEIYVEWLSITRIRDADGMVGNERGRYMATFSDITKRKEDEDVIRHKAYHDPLTDLPNRSLFNDRLRSTLSTARRYRRMFALLYIDLDHFKDVNDEFGHPVGDALLIEAAGRLLACVREADTVARLGGDEFALILAELVNAEEAEQIAARIVETLVDVFRVEGIDVRVSGSVGIALYPDHGRHVVQLKKNADLALYAAKAAGRNGYCFYRETMGRE